MASNPLVVHDHAALEDAIDEQLEFIIGPDIDYISMHSFFFFKLPTIPCVSVKMIRNAHL